MVSKKELTNETLSWSPTSIILCAISDGETPK